MGSITVTLDAEELAALKAASGVLDLPLSDASRVLLLEAIGRVEASDGAEFYNRLNGIRRVEGLSRPRRRHGAKERHIVW